MDKMENVWDGHDCPMCGSDEACTCDWRTEIERLRTDIEKKQAIIDEQKEYCRTTGNDYQAKQIEVMGLKAEVAELRIKR